MDPRQEWEEALRATLASAQEHARAGRTDLAGEVFEKIIAAAPDNPAVLTLTGLAMFGAGAREKALALVRRATALAPEDRRAGMALARMLRDLGLLSDAAEAYRSRLRAEPESATLRFELAGVLDRIDRADEAERLLEEAIALDPAHSGALNLLGTIVDDRGAPETAEDLFRRAHEVGPGQAEPLFNRRSR